MRNCFCQCVTSIPDIGDAALCAVSLRTLSLPLLHCKTSPCHAGSRLIRCCCLVGLVCEHGSISSWKVPCSGTAGVGAGHLLHWALEGRSCLFHSPLLTQLIWNLLLITEVLTSGSVPSAIDAENFISSARLLHKPFKNAALFWVRQHGKTFFSVGHGSLLPLLKKTSCSVHAPYFLHTGTMLRC